MRISLSGNPYMHSSNKRFSWLFTSTAILPLLLVPQSAQAAKANNDPMSFAILGALGSLGMACYQGGKAPCSLTPDIDINKLSFSYDQGHDATLKHYRLALGADWLQDFYQSENFEITGRWEVNLNYWNSTLDNADQDDGYMLGITPVFHYTYKMNTLKPFIEMGGGPQLLSNDTVENEFKSTQFQFGSIFGLGIKNNQFEISYRYLHISNAGIAMPNPGTDFHNIHLGYHF
ncbi:MAG: acyloxyacyl hydrolase [Pseudomonadota bacterium]|nr:acyloxyacyl hydrolase [Pseudomonadota bacterium]